MISSPRDAFERLPYPRVVVVGGGFAGLRLIQGLAGKPFKVLLLDRNNHHCFQPLLYQVATGSLSADSIAHPFRRTVAPLDNVVFRMCMVTGVRAAQHEVDTDHGPVPYDHLVIATGSTTNFFGNSMMAGQAMPLKNISQALDIRSDFLQDFEAALYLQDEASQRRQLNFTIVGAGPTGVELAGAMAEIRKTVLKKEYRELESDRMQIHLVDANGSVLRNFSERSQRKALGYLQDMGVHVRFNARVRGYEDDRLGFLDGSAMETSTVIWAAGVKGEVLPGLEAAFDPKANRYKVDAHNRLEAMTDIYAVGDVALMTADPDHPRGHPQVAQAAIQQARHLAKNLVRGDRSPWVPFRYRDKGNMAVIGRGKAVLDMGRFHMGGVIAWLGWLFVHVMALVGFRNRVQVLFNWAWKYLSWKNTIRLIIRPYVRRSSGAGPSR